MAARRTTARRRSRTARPVRAAAARAVERVLASPAALALLIERLEAAGWHVEHEAPPAGESEETASVAGPAARDRSPG